MSKVYVNTSSDIHVSTDSVKAVNVGVASGRNRYGISVNRNGNKNVDVASGKNNVTVKGGGAGQASPLYTGRTTVIPKAFQSQTLQTSGKRMNRNVIVTEIPYYETSNDAGGITVTIGGN